MADHKVRFQYHMDVVVSLDPIDTFDKRVRTAIGPNWAKVDVVACSIGAHERMERAGLCKGTESPSTYIGKTMFVHDDALDGANGDDED